jgi:cytochrome c oxidase subunit 4
MSEAPMTGVAAHEEGRHVNYVAIWRILVAALIVSLVLANLKMPRLAAALIFSIAIAKAMLVAAYYMHLKFEPRFVIIAVFSGILCLGILFAGLALDIIHVYGK